jgi:hypothetical protein
MMSVKAPLLISWKLEYFRDFDIFEEGKNTLHIKLDRNSYGDHILE